MDRNKKLPGAPGIATRNKKLLVTDNGGFCQCHLCRHGVREEITERYDRIEEMKAQGSCPVGKKTLKDQGFPLCSTRPLLTSTVSI